MSMYNKNVTNRNDKNPQYNDNRVISIDGLFPSDAKSGLKGRKMDIDTIYRNTPLSPDPCITFTSNVLLDRIKKRRAEKLVCYMNMLKYCHNRIADADECNDTDIILQVVDDVPEYKNYDSRECVEYISTKLRDDDFDTVILNDNTLFVTWKYLELKCIDRENILNHKHTSNTNNVSVSRIKI